MTAADLFQAVGYCTVWWFYQDAMGWLDRWLTLKFQKGS